MDEFKTEKYKQYYQEFLDKTKNKNAHNVCQDPELFATSKEVKKYYLELEDEESRQS